MNLFHRAYHLLDWADWSDLDVKRFGVMAQRELGWLDGRSAPEWRALAARDGHLEATIE
jgi:hypothetical protein